MLKVIIMSAIAGCAGTGLGGIAGCLVKGNSKKTMSALFGLAGGVMLGVVLLDLLPESVEISNLWITLISAIVGVIITLVMGDFLAKRVSIKNIVRDTLGATDARQEKFVYTGMMIFASIALHDFPEGLIIGAGEVAAMGFVHTLLIAAHNFPEGMAIALPMRAGGVNPGKIILYSVLSGLPSLFGGIIGYALGGVHTVVTALCLSVSSGAMLAVIFSELLPSVAEMEGKKTMSAVSIIAGILITLIMVSLLE